MTTRLWNYVSTFSNLSGAKLHQIYSKLRQEREAVGVGPSHTNGSTPDERSRGYNNEAHSQSSVLFDKGFDTAKFEAWKRRRRAEADGNTHFQAPHTRPFVNGNSRVVDPNSSGILGAAPSDNRYLGEERLQRMRQIGFPSRQGFSSGVK